MGHARRTGTPFLVDERRSAFFADVAISNISCHLELPLVCLLRRIPSGNAPERQRNCLGLTSYLTYYIHHHSIHVQAISRLVVRDLKTKELVNRL